MGKFEDELQAARGQGILVATRIVGATDAEDVVQAAALKAWKHYPSFRGASQFKTWFTRIVMNEALMLVRRADYKSGVPLEPVAPRLASSRATPEAQVLGQERRDRLAEAILSLKPKLRASILTYAVKEAREGCLSPTEKARVFRAKKKIYEFLGGS